MDRLWSATVRSGPASTGPDQHNLNHLWTVPMDSYAETAARGPIPVAARGWPGSVGSHGGSLVQAAGRRYPGC
jgi:hypothetical protein